MSSTASDSSSKGPPSHAKRLHARLRKAGATCEEIEVALDESCKRERIRNTILRDRLKALTAQIDQLCAQGGNGATTDVRNGSSVEPSIGSMDRLLEIRDQIVEAKAALTRATEKMDGQDESRSNSELVGALGSVGGVMRQIVWILCIGMGVVVPAILVLLVLSIWRMFAG